MRKLILSLHTTLDGFVAGPNGEMDWIKVDDEMFDLVGKFTDEDLRPLMTKVFSCGVTALHYTKPLKQ